MRTLTRKGWLLSAAVGGVAAAVISLPAMQASAAATPGLATTATGVAASQTAAAGAEKTNAQSSSPMTADALAAGRSKYGAKASTDQVLDAYWTPARMRAAKPIEDDAALQAASDRYAAKQASLRQAGKTEATHDGPVRSVTGAAGKLTASKPSNPSLGALPAAYNPNAPYYTPTAYTQGKVFFSKDGGNWVCSGTIVNSEGKDTVWTAGHCVHGGQGGTWASNWTFVPAYDDDLANPRPWGTWSASFLNTRTAWINSSDFSQDMGVAIMNTNLGGWHIVDYFGGQGLTTNRGKNVYDYAFGYPAEWPFDGGNLYRCSGTTSPEWDVWFTWSQTLKMSCDMTRGSSGGGWLYGYDGNWGQLNGVNSRIDRIVNPTIMLSPYFDDDAWSLYNYTRYF